MKAQVMKKAWEIAKDGVKKFGGRVNEYLSEALRIAWQIVKGLHKEVKKMSRVNEIVKKAIEKMDVQGMEYFFKYTEMSIEEKIAATDELIRRIREKELQTRHGEFMKLLSINKEAKKALKPTKPTTKKHGNYIVAKYRGFDAETGERIEVGELIRYCEVNGGWVKADNY